LKGVLDGLFALVTERIKQYVVEQALIYLDDLQQRALVLRDQVVAELDAQVLMAYDRLRQEITQIKAEVREEASQRALERIELDLSQGKGVFETFLDSAMYMNAFNSVAGALGNPAIVVDQASGMFARPTGFDASFQLEYNQLALCPEYREAFYPCGTTAGEMLQGDFRACSPLPYYLPELDPRVECHDGDPTMFAANPNPASCSKVGFGELNGHGAGHGRGSYSLAFPPTEVTRGIDAPRCDALPMPLVYSDGKSDKGLGGGFDEGGSAQGCSLAAGAPRAWPVFAGLLLGTVLVRRRRR
jgi:hypothetical protein